MFAMVVREVQLPWHHFLHSQQNNSTVFSSRALPLGGSKMNTGFKDENTGLLLTQVSTEQDKVLPITRALGLV